MSHIVTQPLNIGVLEDSVVKWLGTGIVDSTF